MLMEFEDADGKKHKVDVSDTVDEYHRQSQANIRNNNRRETRRHTQLSAFNYEDAKFFDSKIDVERSVIRKNTVEWVLSQMTKRERFILLSVFIDERSYTELAKVSGKSPSTIMRECNAAKKKFKKLYGEND